MNASPYDVLKRYWGYSTFRPLQEEIIDTVLSDRDCVALLPTGGGKSICFQVPAMVRAGLTLVISPLIALMNDQVKRLKGKGIAAAAIHSSLHRAEIERILDAAMYGKLKLLYISPERLQHRDFEPRLVQLPLTLLVVDEAHCVSMWGYDFRPAYLKIADLRQHFPNLPMIALTASATKEVLNDISAKLELNEPAILRTDFLRPNLHFGVFKVEDKKIKLSQLLPKRKRAVLVYVRSRRQAREVAMMLKVRGHAASYYHAGLRQDERIKREQGFFNDTYQILVATNAFGMGIDKSDIKMVIHYDVPDSLEAYYQEAGRAGRDGRDAYAILLYNDADRTRLRRQFQASFPSMDTVRRVYHALGNYLKQAVGSGEGRSFPFDFENFAQNYDFDLSTTWHTLKLLEQSGWIVLSEGFYRPSKIRISTEKAQLYEYQIRNPDKAALVQTLLRLYQGILFEEVSINERQLSRILSVDKDQIHSNLLQLDQEKIIHYRPQDDQPRLVMLRERVEQRNLTIDQTLYKFRKQKRELALHEMWSYVETTRCRQMHILRYFDDELDIPCGICDNCRARRRSNVSDQDFQTLRSQVIALLESGEKTIGEIIHQFPKEYHQKLLRVLQYLLNEEILAKADEMISVN